MAVFYSVLMSINVICAFSIFLSGISRRKNHFLALALLNIVLFVFHWFSLQLLSSNNLSESVVISKFHLACIILGYPLYIYIFGLWTEYRYTKIATLLFASFSLPLFVLNFWFDSSLRYGDNVDIVSYITIFNEPANLLVGGTGAYFSYLHLGYGATALFLLFSAFRFYKLKQTDLSAMLVITIVFQITTSYTGYLIDKQQSDWVYIGGVPMSLLSLFVVGLISREYRNQSTKLYEQYLEKESLHKLFSRLAVVSNEGSRNRFYEELLELLSGYTKADYVLFGLIDDENSKYIKTRVAFKGNKQIPNFAYERKGSPCEIVLTAEVCLHKAGVANDYPEDVMLKNEGVEGYIGYPILAADQSTIGVLALLYEKPIVAEQSLRTVTDVFSTRISAELRREILQDELKATAFIDYLTQLPNRIKLLSFINKTKHEVEADESQALLLLFDLDYFGEVNRKYDYEIGDKVIKIIGERLRSYAADGVFIARCSGDEFAVVIPRVRTDIAKLANVHWTAISAIIKQTCFVGSRRINVGCSMGAVVFPTQLDANLDVLGCAEQALMQAKENGRDKYLFFDPALLMEMECNRELEEDLVNALKIDDGLAVYYQPKVDRDGQIMGAEALLRWFSKSRGFVSPADFIPIAEGSGVIHDLGRWVLHTVLSDIREWKLANLHLVPISINITASQFDDDEFIDELISLVKQYDVETELLELELTESGLLTDKSKAIETLGNIRTSGITIALDDFGTGYSSLSYLSELPLDVLKIDKMFVDGLANDKNRELVKSIIAISQAMDLTNVAEGTETLEQVDLLASYGCKYFQGYYFSKPIGKTEFTTWLANKS